MTISVKWIDEYEFERIRKAQLMVEIRQLNHWFVYFRSPKRYAGVRKEVPDMDQVKIGKFIASCRKEQGMTQAVLADKLGISDRAVSKWETGKSMPDSSIMLELCGYLQINVNELLSGERISMENYDKKAEEKSASNEEA